MTQDFIQGSGGKKKKSRSRKPAPIVHHQVVQQAPAYQAPRAPVRTADNLSSKQYATFLDVVSEGEIEGFPSARDYKNPPVDASGDPISETAEELATRQERYNKSLLKDIFLNDSPILQEGADVTDLQSSDYNLSGYEVEWRAGTQDQSSIRGFGDIESDITVDSNTPVRKEEPKTRRVYDDDVDAVRVSISLPRLQSITTYGDVYGSVVELRILRKYANESDFSTVVEDKIEGRTADLYVRDYQINLDGAFPVDIRVERVTDDAADENTQNEIYWTVITHIVNQRLRYPNTALVATRLDASEFGSVPNRSYRLRGIKVPIPTGTTVDQGNGRIIYPDNFIWDGTFTAPQWTTCPSMLLLEILTNKTFGFGDQIQLQQLDRWSFLEASKYSCTLIDKGDGSGETEPRFSCNGVLRNSDNAYKLINDLSSVFRCMAYWATGTIQISQDRPRDSTFLFNSDNVLEEGFLYRNASQKTRHTVVTVSYFNMDLRQVDYVVAEDQDGVRKWGIIQTEIKAFCCTSRTQAKRLAKWLLYTESAESEVCEFKTSIGPGSVVRPGSIITISDQTKIGKVSSGHVLGVANGELQTVAPLTQEYVTALVTISGDHPQDTTFDRFTYVTKGGTVRSRPVRGVICPPVTLSSDERSQKGTIIVDTKDLENDEYPVSGVPYALEEAGGVTEASKWRVLSVIEEEDGIYGITAMAHNPSKYAFIEAGEPLQERELFSMSPEPEAPSALVLEEKPYVEGNKVSCKLIASWQAQEGAQRYRILYRRTNDSLNWQQDESTTNSYELLGVSAGTYEVRVFSVSSGIFQSQDYASATITTYGKTEPPFNVEGLSAHVASVNSQIGDVAAPRVVELRWDASEELDVINGGHVRIHRPTTAENSWENSIEVVTTEGGAKSVTFAATHQQQTYLVCFEDEGGRVSPTPAIITVQATSTIQAELLTVVEFDLLNGTKTMFPGHPTLEVTSGPAATRWEGRYWRILKDNGLAPAGGLVLAGTGKVDGISNSFDNNVDNLDLRSESYPVGVFTSNLTFTPEAGKWSFIFEDELTTGQAGAISHDQKTKEVDSQHNFDNENPQLSRVETGLIQQTSVSDLRHLMRLSGDNRSHYKVMLNDSNIPYKPFVEINDFDVTRHKLYWSEVPNYKHRRQVLIDRDQEQLLPTRTTVTGCKLSLKLERRTEGVVTAEVSLSASQSVWIDFKQGFYIVPSVIALDASTYSVTAVERNRFQVTATSATTKVTYVASGYGQNLN